MSLFFSVLGLGFLLGVRHATDADHVAAVSTFVSREQNISRATRIGILWGIGHSLSVTLVALPIILFSLTIPEHFSLIFEFMVGMMLITTFLGVSVSVIRRKSETIHKYLVIFSGLASLAFGLYILFSVI